MLTEKKYNALYNLTKNLYAIGFVIETILYYAKTNNILRWLSLIPFLINFFLIVFLLYSLKKDDNDLSERNSKMKKGLINFTFNVLFIIFVICRILILKS
jgi:archaellum biogenesis protein FlaJ (TadC family)